MAQIDKKALLAALCDKLAEELSRTKQRAQAAAEGATHEENRAEGDKDMRATEASYVARGHAERTEQLEQALKRLTQLTVGPLPAGSKIQTSALIHVACAGRQQTYFMVPAAGGERVAFAGVEIQTLTPQSPLGAALLGLTEGDETEVTSPQGLRLYEIHKVE